MTTRTAFNSLRDNMIHWRQRQCLAANPFFVPDQQICYPSCPAGYGTVTVSTYCVLCSVSCASCEGDGVSCLSCNTSNNRQLNNKTCSCFSGYFDNSTSVCYLCHYSCLTCTSLATNCTSCPANSSRTITNNSCPCDSGLYDPLTNSSTCLTCSYSCLTCISSNTNCTSCTLTLNRIFDSDNLKCPCKSGYRDDGVPNCTFINLTCSIPCVTCSITASNCTSCNSTLKRKLVNNSCICDDGFRTVDAFTCSEICGDSKIKGVEQCDDGNTLDGDGCSSSCQI